MPDVEIISIDSKIAKPTKHLVIAGFLWAGVQFWGGSLLGLINNERCFKYLGCNAGFFGFDAVIHFFGGILCVAFVLWFIHRYPKLNILHETFWKNAVILLAIAALVGFCWEVLEFSVDHFRMYELHQSLSMKDSAQVSNSDTMGDLTFGLLGSCSAIFAIEFLKRKNKE